MIVATTPRKALIIPGCCIQNIRTCTPCLHLGFYEDWDEDRSEAENLKLLEERGVRWEIGSSLGSTHPALREGDWTASYCPFCGAELPVVRLREKPLPVELGAKPWDWRHGDQYQVDERFAPILMFEVVPKRGKKQLYRGLWGKLLEDPDMLGRVLGCFKGDRFDQLQQAVDLSNWIKVEGTPEELLKKAQVFGPHMTVEDEYYGFLDQITALEKRFSKRSA